MPLATSLKWGNVKSLAFLAIVALKPNSRSIKYLSCLSSFDWREFTNFILKNKIGEAKGRIKTVVIVGNKFQKSFYFSFYKTYLIASVVDVVFGDTGLITILFFPCVLSLCSVVISISLSFHSSVSSP